MPTSLTFFAVHNVNTSFLGMNILPAQYQVLNPLVIVVMSPILAWAYTKIRATHATKFCLGMTLCALAFLVLYVSKFTASGDSTAKDIRGLCASVGRAEGTVCLVGSVKDLPKMKQGAILVSSMTRPELVPAMRKAAAIVTDEGGITSHAAIVSRELGIPCVIGTKIATKVFKDGDFVEVNANHGIIRKIRK